MLTVIAFRIGQQQFSVNVENVREIRGRMDISPLAHAPAHVLGIVELRGQVIPVLDVGRCLGLEMSGCAAGSAVIVAENDGKMVGLLVDDVSDMISVSDENIQPVPRIGPESEHACLSAILVLDTHLVTHLDLPALTGGKDVLAA
ncbi:MAG: chemotaxis protein CheW [Zhengella sp.]|uniref:chemotaxis protein CheW n=1 Tax=Zhengella sp. TaxID=2282762 RepID=UPI001D818D22|nr:purine-binding chemotaxis protein CheW [Notoacmeibacter sp.]MCC0026653.1 purine-binding chemotaxis protein CheW [Brucellaceae bacterium]